MGSMLHLEGATKDGGHCSIGIKYQLGALQLVGFDLVHWYSCHLMMLQIIQFAYIRGIDMQTKIPHCSLCKGIILVDVREKHCKKQSEKMADPLKRG